MKRLAALALVGAALAARAATTNEVDVAALLAVADNNATTTTNGWKLCNIGLYADPVLQFNSKDDWMLSPDFGVPILRMEFSVRCTADTARRLAVFDESTGGQIREFALCAKGNTDEPQAFDFTPEEALTRFRLKMNAHGAPTGNWGVGEIKVVTAEPAASPTGICVSRKGADWSGLSWNNGEGTVSNRVDTYLVERGAGEDVLLSTDFGEFSAKGQPVLSTNKLSAIDLALSGVNIYAPTNTSGICQVGTGRELGFLRYDGISDYSNVVLRMRAKRFPGDNAETTIISVDSAGVTNEVDTIELGNEYADYEIDLSSIVNADSALLLGYYKTKSNRRILLDSLSIARESADRETSVDSRWIPATTGAAAFSTKDHGIVLAPKSEYRFEVRAQNADGLVSDPATVDVVFDAPSGFRFILR